jgi:hypothetical protein
LSTSISDARKRTRASAAIQNISFFEIISAG